MCCCFFQGNCVRCIRMYDEWKHASNFFDTWFRDCWHPVRISECVKKSEIKACQVLCCLQPEPWFGLWGKPRQEDVTEFQHDLGPIVALKSHHGLSPDDCFRFGVCVSVRQKNDFWCIKPESIIKNETSAWSCWSENSLIVDSEAAAFLSIAWSSYTCAISYTLARLCKKQSHRTKSRTHLPSISFPGINQLEKPLGRPSAPK